MDSQPTDLQQELSAHFAEYFDRELIRPGRDPVGQAAGFDRRLWSEFVRLGGLAPALGDGESAPDFGAAAGIALQIGRRLAPVPYVEVVAAVRLAERTGVNLPADAAGAAAVWAGELVGPAIPDEILSSAGAVADGILLIGDDRLSVVAVDGVRVTRAAADNLGALPMGRVSVARAGLIPEVVLGPAAVQAFAADRRLLCAALMIGAGQAALEQALAHVRQRHQFGRPIGSFQVLQHRLADCSTALTGAELLLRRGASMADADPARCGLAARAFTAAASAAELAAREAMQMFGGYGVCLEYDLHRFLSYVKAWRVLGRDRYLSDDALREPDGTSMPPARFGLNPWSAPYRARVAAFVDQHMPPGVLKRVHASGTFHDAGIHAALAEAGWIGGSWPARNGGSGSDANELSAMWEALNYFGVPVDILELTEMVAYVLCRAGTDEQQREILPRVRRGECLISLGYTEAEAGSDVAAARTVATRDGDGWRISGAKMFTTGAHVADLVFLLARTDADGLKHKSLTLFLVPLNADGVQISPVRTFGGERTNATFFDAVRVPDTARVGEVNGGWPVLQLALAFERSMMGTYLGRAQRSYDDLLTDLGAAVAEPAVRAVLVGLAARIEAARALADHVTCLITANADYAVAAAMTKLVVTEVFKDLTYAALDLVGGESLVTSAGSRLPTGGRLEEWFRGSQVATIYGGSNEIQREIITRRHLALPR